MEFGRSHSLYAYKYDRYEYTVQPAVRRVRPLPKRKPAQKKKNTLQRFIALCVTMPLLVSYAIFVMPLGLKNITIPLLSDRIVPLTTSKTVYPVNNNYSYNYAENTKNIMFPTSNYLENENYLGSRYFIKKSLKKNSQGMSDLYLTDVMYDLKQKLQALGSNYKTLSPSIFVWDFNSGKYVDLNAETPYPAASIIKLPVLVSLFKNTEIEAANLYDDMTLTEYYRSSGSGHMQYQPAGTKYTVDNLAKVMMQDSDNTATNMLISKLGSTSAVNADIRKWGLQNTYIKTWLPDLSGTNTTSARDIAKILCNLDNPAFLNVNSRSYIYDYMSHIRNNGLIPKGLPEGTPFVHKTGDIGTMLGDAGIVHMPNGNRYAVVIMVKRPHNSPQAVTYIQQASKIIYDHCIKYL